MVLITVIIDYCNIYPNQFNGVLIPRRIINGTLCLRLYNSWKMFL